MQIGPYTAAPAVALAPMAGITDKPFRILARRALVTLSSFWTGGVGLLWVRRLGFCVPARA